MTDIAANNKRIAKNTVFLYIRMLFIMLITLYTSRVLLQALGVVDFGIYNVVGGVISLFMIVSGSLSTATQRFLSYGIGKNDNDYLNRVFSTSVFLHICIGLLIVTLTETIGYYFFEQKMVIPLERINAAKWVFHCAVLSLFVMVLGIPYNALIIAHEKMGVYACISILDALLKLLTCIMIQFVHYDKLKFYAILLLLLQIIVQVCYLIYCNIYYKEDSKIRIVKDVKLIKEIGSFSFWSILGNSAFLSYTQGINILLNVFFGPIVNAARAIAVQVQSAVNQLTNSFQMALNPQIIKSYASGKLSYMHNLLYVSSRCSFYLLFICSFPVFMGIELFLKIWLVNVPDHTVVFVRIILITTWINSMANPLITAVKATGNIRYYEIVISGIMLLILPVSYLFLRFGYSSYIVFVVHLVVEFCAQCLRVIIASRIIKFSIANYLREVVWRVISVSFLTIVIPVLLYMKLNNSIVSVIIISSIALLLGIINVVFVGLTKGEQSFVADKMKKIIQFTKH